ncbi:trypsin-like peptidase domain-containing protein [Azospirillum sp. B21]|uniref:S1C family serine protease n=1 Tax=Azospirillum sp. B21 TaxID=2607496 RepID=UPI00165F0A27|nr:trypsin-like peptidase domain-containing protein [Azospirillum sp. B21]
MQRLAALATAIALSLLTLQPALAGCDPTGFRVLPASTASTVKITIRTFGGQPAFGTGVIWDSDGHIVTNDHVATVGDQHTVTLASGERRAARVVARSPDQDLAVLSVDGPLPPAAPRASAATLQPGDAVLAIGNPFGQGTTLSTGIVNGFGREVITAPNRHMMGMVETTVPLRPGNSGGPLLSCRGEVVGINTAAVQTAPGGSTLGFAIPMEIADAAVARMLGADTAVAAAPDFGSRFPAESGTLQRGSARPGLGLYVVPGGAALVVQQVVPGSPAARAGALPGDAIIEANGRMVSSPEDLQSMIRDASVGAIAVLRILRSGVALDMAVRITPVVFSP